MKTTYPEAFDSVMRNLEAEIREKTTDFLVAKHLEDFEKTIRPKISEYVEQISVEKMVQHHEVQNFNQVLEIHINDKLAGSKS